MNKFLILFLILFSLILVKACNESNAPHYKLESFWKRYVKIVRSKDFDRLKPISLPKIHCTVCLENSPDEDSLITNFKMKNPDSWYDKVYGELAYIPLDKFIKQDMNIFFDENLLKLVKNSSKVDFISREFEKEEQQQYLEEYLDSGKKYKLHEALVTTKEPSTQYEGAQVVIQILETNQGLKFYGFATIP